MPTTLFATRGRLRPEANPKAFDPHQFVPFLMARVGSLMVLSFTPHLERSGLTIHMWRVVLILSFNGPLTLVEISRFTGLQTSTLSRLVGRMIHKRLLTRRRSQEDARTVQINLRRKGRALFRELWPEAVKAQDLVIAPFSSAEVENFKEMLRQIEIILVDRLETRRKSEHEKSQVSGAR